MSTILSPIISEQSMQNAGNGKFTFRVAKEADKTAIKKEIEKQFGVKVIGITTQIIKGKSRRYGSRRVEIQSTPIKKAVVRLEKGQKIAMFDLGEKK